jgi:hypothetical protein
MLFQPGPQCEIGFLFFNAASGAVPGDSPRVATLTQCRLLGPRHREPTRVAPVEDSAGRFSLICAPSASRGRGVERAGHLLLDALHCAGADAQLAGNLEDALTGAQLSSTRSCGTARCSVSQPNSASLVTRRIFA